MSLNNISIGVQVLDNGWDTTDSPAHGDNNVTESGLLELASEAGSQIARIPLDLSEAGSDGIPQWLINDIGAIISTAAANGSKLILQFGQTPAELTTSGDVGDVPTQENVNELAARFATAVEQIYNNFGSQYGEIIAGFEVGNEPNLTYNYTGNPEVEESPETNRFFSVSAEDGEKYAEYLNAVNLAIDAKAITVDGTAIDVNVIGAGVAHNDVAYLDSMFARLKELGSTVDGFAIHPYSTLGVDDYGNQIAPESGRPTDWVEIPTSDYSDSWDYYYSFQGALYTVQSLLIQYGYGEADLWITEFGVPSYLGYRNAGEEGVDDQARWYAEAFGVVDSWGNQNLKALISHHVLDNHTYETNSQYNAYDGDPNNDGTWFEGEGAFGLFHEVNGQIVAKPAVALMNSIVSRLDYSNLNIFSNYTNTIHDFSSALQSTGLTSGIILLAHDGDDTLTGSNYDDSLFAGEGNDTVHGGNGNDIIYGGSGDDLLFGGAGNDDIYGNEGNDIIAGGNGVSRIDGGVGIDTLKLDGLATDYSWSGDGAKLTLTGNGVSVTALNMENLQFGDNSTQALTNTDVLKGNGGILSDSNPVIARNDVGINLVRGNSVTINPLSNDTTTESSSPIISAIDGQQLNVGENTVVAGVGMVTLKSDHTIDVIADKGNSGEFQFEYTASSGAYSDTSTISGSFSDKQYSGFVGNDDLVVANQADAIKYDVLANDEVGGANDVAISKINGVDVAEGRLINLSGLGVAKVADDGAVEIMLRPGGRPGANGDHFKHVIDTSLVDTAIGPSDVSTSSNDAIEINYTFSGKSGGSVVNETGSGKLSVLITSGLLGEVENDSLKGTVAGEVLNGLSGNDVIYGLQGDDTLYGKGDNDTLYGGEGSDMLFGGEGTDILVGGNGDDTLIGGNGSDVFRLLRGDGNDLVMDFNVGIDQIDLSDFNFGAYSQVSNLMVTTYDGVIIALGDASLSIDYLSASDLSSGDFIL